MTNGDRDVVFNTIEEKAREQIDTFTGPSIDALNSAMLAFIGVNIARSLKEIEYLLGANTAGDRLVGALENIASTMSNRNGGR